METERMIKAKKKRIKRYITWAALAALVVLLAAMPLLAQQEVEADGPQASILSGTVEMGTVTTSLRGGGNLQTRDAEDVNLPSGVKITEFLVRNGDTVTAGTPVAAVDKVSVMTAIVEVTDTLDTLRSRIESARDDTVGSYVKATAGGRIKEVYAQKGEAVQDVMLRDGALAVLSLDGLMAVQLEKDAPLATGDSVVVTFPNGTEETGRVESNLDGVLTVTVEDAGYDPETAVTVSTEAGEQLGTGALYIHNAWKATAFTGTISTVSARDEAEVSAGATLFTLTDTDYQAEMEYLSGKHREYEELLQELFAMYESGVLTAPCDGVVSGVDKDSAHLLSSVPESWTVAPLNAVTEGKAEKGWTVMLLSNQEVICTKDENCPLEPDSLEHQEGCIKACDKDEHCDATVHHKDCIKRCDHAATDAECDGGLNHYPDCIRSCAHGKTEADCKATKYHYSDCIHSCTASDGTKACPATGEHKKTCIVSCDHADAPEGCDATLHHYSDCIGACVNASGAGTPCPANKHNASCYFYGMTYKAQAAKVFAVGATELVVNGDLSGTVYAVEKSGSGWKLSGDAKLNTQLLIAPETAITVANPKHFRAGDIILLVYGYRGEEQTPVWSDVVLYQQAQSGTMGSMEDLKDQMSKLEGMMAGMSGLSGLMGSYGGTTQMQTQTGDGLFDLDGSTLLTVTPQDTVSLTITLDEQDIAKVSVGMEAQVKAEALRGRTFDAVVTKLGTAGTNSGGSSKFTVELEMAGDAEVLDGMSATAELPLYTRLDVLTIPVKALVEKDGKTYVCTALDKETGEPAAPVAVETGLSDGENVEILSGLKLGDTFYYSYYDTLELDTKAEASQGFGF